jgi:hypothetical protein
VSEAEVNQSCLTVGRDERLVVIPRNMLAAEPDISDA